jgi:hypothetical protein
METTTTFTLSMTGKDTQKPFNGTFKAKLILTIREKLYADAERRQLVGPSPEGTPPAPSMQGYGYMLGQLRARLVEYPEWWKDSNFGSELEDDNIVEEIWDKVFEAEKEYKAGLQKEVKGIAKSLREKDKDK